MVATAGLREAVEREAREANRAAPSLTDDAVAEALAAAAALVRERGAEILAANGTDCEEAAGRVDEGMLDRLRLDEQRAEALAVQVEAVAALEPLERVISSWTLSNGLQVSERRIPIGTVGANFEARPNVALDVAGQLLKSLNAAVLRTGGAALRTVTVLVDDVLRPALERAGLPPEAVGLVRSADREGARVLVSMPALVPLVILRGSGPSTAELARLAAQSGVRTLAHAEGGGVLYVHEAAAPGKALALAEASLDRLGVCNRLNLALVDRGAAGIVTEDGEAAERFLDGYRGTAAFWHAPTRFTDGFELTGAPETGINVDRLPGPRGPVTYRDLWLRQYRIVGDGTQAR